MQSSHLKMRSCAVLLSAVWTAPRRPSPRFSSSFIPTVREMSGLSHSYRKDIKYTEIIALASKRPLMRWSKMWSPCWSAITKDRRQRARKTTQRLCSCHMMTIKIMSRRSPSCCQGQGQRSGPYLCPIKNLKLPLTQSKLHLSIVKALLTHLFKTKRCTRYRMSGDNLPLRSLSHQSRKSRKSSQS